MVDFSTKTDDEIDSWIANHERHKKTDSDLYRSLILERDRRFGRGLNINVSMHAMIDAAKAGRFISYGGLAEANGIAWSKARHLMNGKHGHLDNLLAHCNAQGFPLFTAIVVQKGKLSTGEMDDFTLAGFVEGAQRIGRDVTDAKSFLKQCQKECFSWAGSSTDIHPG
jgi:hypothetical protein